MPLGIFLGNRGPAGEGSKWVAARGVEQCTTETKIFTKIKENFHFKQSLDNTVTIIRHFHYRNNFDTVLEY